MPLYDYECRNCGHIVEVMHGVNDSGPTACEQLWRPDAQAPVHARDRLQGLRLGKEGRSRRSAQGHQVDDQRRQE